MVNHLSYKASDGENIKLSIYSPKTKINGKTIILVHGFKGFKDWGFGPYTANFFAENGFFVLSFNFSHNGIGENLTEFTEFEKFASNTFSREIRELNEIIDSIRNGNYEIPGDTSIYLLGHSRGGGISLLTTPNRDDISGIAAWASVATFDRYSERQKIEWRKKGVFEVMNMRTKQVFKLNVTLLDDLEINSEKLNIENAVKNLGKPLLIIHGEQDLAVPIKEAEKIFNWADKSKTEFHKISAAGHTFDVVHPFEGSNPKFAEVLNLTKIFFNK
jgi:dienelactone hydrolase